MRRLAIAAASAALAARCFAAAASQEWVMALLAGLDGDTNGVVSVTLQDGRTLTGWYEPYSAAALSVTNSANATVTNGTLFAWNGDGKYLNVPAGLEISATATNLVFGAAQSAVVGDLDTFADAQGGAFAVFLRRISESEAKRLKGE